MKGVNNHMDPKINDDDLIDLSDDLDFYNDDEFEDFD
jgi:hypothetical protein